jgi:hypothetical protein
VTVATTGLACDRRCNRVTTARGGGVCAPALHAQVTPPLCGPTLVVLSPRGALMPTPALHPRPASLRHTAALDTQDAMPEPCSETLAGDSAPLLPRVHNTTSVWNACRVVLTSYTPRHACGWQPTTRSSSCPARRGGGSERQGLRCEHTQGGGELLPVAPGHAPPGPATRSAFRQGGLPLLVGW